MPPRWWRTWIALAALASALVALMMVAPAHARLSFGSCEALRQRFAHGVARSSEAAERQVAEGHAVPAHARHARNVYRANQRVLDHDHDGTVCEA